MFTCFYIFFIHPSYGVADEYSEVFIKAVFLMKKYLGQTSIYAGGSADYDQDERESMPTII